MWLKKGQEGLSRESICWEERKSHTVAAEKSCVCARVYGEGCWRMLALYWCTLMLAFVGSVWGLILFSSLQLDPSAGVEEMEEGGWSCWGSQHCTYRFLSLHQNIPIINPFTVALCLFPAALKLFHSPRLWGFQWQAGKLHSEKSLATPIQPQTPLLKKKPPKKLSFAPF